MRAVLHLRCKNDWVCAFPHQVALGASRFPGIVLGGVPGTTFVQRWWLEGFTRPSQRAGFRCSSGIRNIGPRTLLAGCTGGFQVAETVWLQSSHGLAGESTEKDRARMEASHTHCRGMQYVPRLRDRVPDAGL